MKAARYKQYGPPDVVKVENCENPKVEDHTLLIEVVYSTVNRTDSGIRSAEYVVSRLFSGLFRPTYQVLGSEFTGVVVEVGKNVSSHQVGDRIVGFNDVHFGGHAEFVLLNEKDAFVSIPESIPFEKIAPLCEGAHYALNIIRAAKLTSTSKVLVYGGTGAIGSAGIQLLKALGVYVIAVCHSSHVKLVESLGTDEVIPYDSMDYTTKYSEIDFVFDAVGKSSFKAAKKVLTKKGIYISTELGKRGVNIPLALFTPMFGGKRVLFPIPKISKEDVQYLLNLYLDGKLVPLIDKTFYLDEIVEAYRYVETGQKIGNVLLKIQK
jgi:NADPH:quinone reductase-like Zn-dependent oxidoreductase